MSHQIIHTSGSAIMIILITVALFGALSWAWMENSRSSTGWLTDEQTKAVATATTECQNQIDAAIERLMSRGCDGYVSVNTSGALLGVAGEPTDGSCALYHPNGGGIKPCGGILSICLTPLASLALGERCGDVVYVGTSGGRMYAKVADQGTAAWKTSTTCTAGNIYTLPELPNHPAAQLCAAMGPEWVLPSRADSGVIFGNLAVGEIGNIYQPTEYWTSAQNGCANAFIRNFSTGTETGRPKNNIRTVKCIKR